MKSRIFLDVIGDSLCHNRSFDVRLTKFWPHVLAGLLTDEIGRTVHDRNKGISGNTSRTSTTGGGFTGSTGMVERIATITGQTQLPEVLCVFGTRNNYTCISSGATLASFAGTTANVYSLTLLPDLTSIIDAAFDAGIPRVVVMGHPLSNFATGGDISGGAVIAEPSLLVDPGAVMDAGCRWAQYSAYLQAVTDHGAANVVWCDLYARMKTKLETDYPARIGDDTLWQNITGDVHFNTLANADVAQMVLDAITEHDATLATAQKWLGTTGLLASA